MVRLPLVKYADNLGLKAQPWAKGSSDKLRAAKHSDMKISRPNTPTLCPNKQRMAPIVCEDKSASGNPPNAAAPLVKDEDKDIAIALVGEHRHDLDPAIEARVVRKIDLFLVPAMTVGYGLVYYDKVSRYLKIHNF